MAFITDLAPTTELEAINAMLSAIGEGPITLDNASQSDVETAINLLKDTSREVLSRGWRFNTEYNYPVTPTATYLEGADTLNVFRPPADLLGFQLSARDDQFGMDAIERLSRTYLDGGQPVTILADRLTGYDGFDVATLYINPVWFKDFVELPESARRYITVVAARRFTQHLGMEMNEAKAQFSEKDEQMALQLLQKDQIYSQPQAAPGAQATTELGALNQILSSVGQDEVPSIMALTREAVTALNALRQVSREVQGEGWTFNKDLTLRLEPVTTTVVGGDTLNVFTPPSNLTRWELSRTSEQVGLRVALRPPKTVAGYDEVFYDRDENRDGFLATAFPYLYIDAVYLFEFSQLPQSAKDYITALAARQFAERLPNIDPNKVAFTVDDVQRSRIKLVRDQGTGGRRNIFNTLESRQALGGRADGYGGAVVQTPTN